MRTESGHVLGLRIRCPLVGEDADGAKAQGTVDGILGSVGVGGEEMDVELSAEDGQRLSNSGLEPPVDGDGAVHVAHEVGELESTEVGDVDGEHERRPYQSLASRDVPEVRQVIAVDWSGSLSAARRHLWVARVLVDGANLVELAGGRSAEEVVDFLLRLLECEPATVVGLDFAFSLPAWFLRRLGIDAVDQLWQADAERERWLRPCLPPFWGRPPTWRRPPLSGPELRRTEQELRISRGIRIKSVFQVGGAGQVGTASLRGMSALRRLRAAGIAVWPFDPWRLPVVAEIYPRVFTGAVVTASRVAREKRLADLDWPHGQERATMAAAADAFDAGIAARGLALAFRAQRRGVLAARDRLEELEGRILVSEVLG